jgi:hypothetical protein
MPFFQNVSFGPRNRTRYSFHSSGRLLAAMKNDDPFVTISTIHRVENNAKTAAYSDLGRKGASVNQGYSVTGNVLRTLPGNAVTSVRGGLLATAAAAACAGCWKGGRSAIQALGLTTIVLQFKNWRSQPSQVAVPMAVRVVERSVRGVIVLRFKPMTRSAIQDGVVL